MDPIIEHALTRIGTATGARYPTVDHRLVLTPPDLVGAPTPTTTAGSVAAVAVHQAPAGESWTPVHGVTVAWQGAGDEAARTAYVTAVTGWLTGVFAVLERKPG